MPFAHLALRAALFVLSAGTALSQTAGRLTFEAVEIKPNTSGANGSSSDSSRSQTIMTNMSLRRILERALAIKSYQLAGPDWMDNARFDIAAKYPIDAKPEDRGLVMRNFLEDRFGLVMHQETREMEGMALVATKKFKLKPVEEHDGTESHGDGTVVNFKAKGASMTDLAEYLGRRFNLIVADKTGLAGFYSFEMKYAADRGDPKDADPSGPTIYSELEDKAGLKLQPSKVPIQVYVVDKLERSPKEN